MGNFTMPNWNQVASWRTWCLFDPNDLVTVQSIITSPDQVCSMMVTSTADNAAAQPQSSVAPFVSASSISAWITVPMSAASTDWSLTRSIITTTFINGGLTIADTFNAVTQGTIYIASSGEVVNLDV